MPQQRATSNQRSKEQVVMQRRTEQLEQIIEILGILKQSKQKVLILRKQISIMDSVSLGLYEEVDKLSKKAPADMITDLALEQVNDVIRDTKQLLEGDAYIQRQKEFVPAGDNPQHRDIVVVLRQIRQGLDRYQKLAEPTRTLLNSRIEEAELVKAALETFIAGKLIVSEEDIKKLGIKRPSSDFGLWFTNYPAQFDFDRLDNINISEHFMVEEYR